jgi:hypothetical protein
VADCRYYQTRTVVRHKKSPELPGASWFPLKDSPPIRRQYEWCSYANSPLTESKALCSPIDLKLDCGGHLDQCPLKITQMKR